MATKKMTVAALSDMLRSHKGNSFVTITTATKPKVLKKDRVTKEENSHGQIVKVSRVNGCIGFRYENSVNNQRIREGSEADFEAAPRTWGEHVNGPEGFRSPLVEHNGRTYLEIKVERSLDRPTYYGADGNEIPYEACKGVLPPRKTESQRQELDSEIILRDYAVGNITRIMIDGDEIEIVS